MVTETEASTSLYFDDLTRIKSANRKQNFKFAAYLEHHVHATWRAVLAHPPARAFVKKALELKRVSPAVVAPLDHDRKLLDRVMVDVEPRPPEWLASVQEQRRCADAARQVFVTANLRLVLNTARKLQGRGLNQSDLIQEGNIGLMRAVDRFEHRKGFSFSTYASHWIRAAMTRALDNHGREIRIPVCQLRKHRDAGFTMVPFDEADSWDELASSDPAPDDKTVDAQMAEHLTALVGHLSPRDANVIRLRFGLDGQEPMTLSDVGKRYGVSKEMIRLIQNKALARLKTMIRP